MRRQLRHQLFAGAVVVAVLVTATTSWLERRSAQALAASAERVDGARRSITYVLERDGPWLEFPVQPGRDAIRFLTTANARRAEVRELPLPARLDYAFDYQLLGRGTRPGTDQETAAESTSEPFETFHQRAFVMPGTARQYYTSTALQPLPSQVVRIDLRGRRIDRVRIRLASAAAPIADVGLRVNSLEPVDDREAGFRWQRLTREQQAALFGGSTYPPEFARPEERRALTHDRWSPLGPDGIRGRDYRERILYTPPGDDEDTEDDDVAPPPGLPVDRHLAAVVPVPPNAGRLHLAFEPRDPEGRGPGIVALEFFPDGPGSTRRWRVDLEAGRGRFEADLEAGALVVVGHQPLVVTARGDREARPGEPLDLTPEPVLSPSWQLLAATPARWRVSHLRDAPTPVRIDLRAVRADATGQTLRRTPRVRVSGLDANGTERRLAVIEVPWRPAPFERVVGGTLLRTGAPVRMHLQIPPDIETLTLDADAPVVASLAQRPPDLPLQVRAPIDAYSFPLDPPAATLFHALVPVDAQELARAGRRVLIARQQAPSPPDPDILAGRYEWTRLDPATLRLGREVLIPRPGRVAVRPQATGSWFRRLDADQHLEFPGDAAGPGSPGRLRPTLLWFAEAPDPGRLSVRIDGERVLDAALGGRQGAMNLPEITPGRRRIEIQAPRGVATWINEAGRGTGENLLRRFAYRIAPGDVLDVPIDKRDAAETVTLTLFPSTDRTEDARLRVELLTLPERPAVGTAFTPRIRDYRILPPDARPEPIGSARVLGSAVRPEAGTAVYFPLNEDVPAGPHLLRVRPGRASEGYVSIHRLRPGASGSRRFRLERTDAEEPAETYDDE